MTAHTPAPAGGYPDAGVVAQAAAEEHLAACFEAEDAYEQAMEDGTDLADLDTPACAPFDGCQTCEIREILYAAWPVFTADVVARLRAAGHTDAADLVAAYAT